MFANLDFYCGLAMTIVFAGLAVLCGALALHGWGTVMFATPGMWDVALYQYQQRPGTLARDYLAFEVYICPVLAWLFGWMASMTFRGR